MKKKLMAILAAFVAVTPLAGVKAADINYEIGSEHNFIVNKEQYDKHAKGDETVGVKVISLGEKTSDGYVKGLAVGAPSMQFGWLKDPAGDEKTYKDLRNYTSMLEDLNGSRAEDAALFKGLTDYPKFELTTDYVKNYNTDASNVDIMSAQDFLSWFQPASTLTAGQTYTLTSEEMNKFQLWFAYPLGTAYTWSQIIESIKNENPVLYENFKNTKMQGFTTKSYDATTGKIWVVNFEFTGNNITSVVLKEVDAATISDDLGYFTVPILYFNEIYNCRFEVVPSYSCYKCDDKYQWLEVGKQASTCTIVSGVTSKAKCTDNPKTGVEDYILEFAVAAGICGIVLLAVKRKSLFSRV